jgi:hypothetical protein
MIELTTQWFIKLFNEQNISGWQRALDDDRPADPDFSLQVMGARARVHVQVGRRMPANIEAAVLGMIKGTAVRPYQPSQQETLHLARHNGIRSYNYTARAFWYPWAIEAMGDLAIYAEKQDLPEEMKRAIERSQSYLIVDLSDTMLDEVSRALPFVVAEYLYGLGRVK